MATASRTLAPRRISIRRLALPRRPTGWTLAVAAGALALVGLHVWWLVRMRQGQPLDTDEAGYLTIALNDRAGLHDGGLSGLWDAFQQQIPNAPLVPLLTVPVLVVREGILPAYTVQLAALLLLVAATYGLGSRLATPRWGALAALVVAASPGVVDYTRAYHFAVPCAALFTAALYALVRSDHLLSTGWALAWGALLGLALLARTMVVGFLPGVFVAGAVLAAAGGSERRWRRWANLAAAAGAMFLVAAIWYARNLDAVVDYLRGFGYGSHSSEYGSAGSVTSLHRWTGDLRTAMHQELYLPLAALMAILLVCGAAIGVQRARGEQWTASLRRLAASPVVSLVIVCLTGYVALVSTQNEGSAFALPIVSPAIVLAALGASLLPARALRTAAVVGLVAVSVFSLVVKSHVSSGTARDVAIDLPGVGNTVVTDGRGTAVGALKRGSATRFSEHDKLWQKRWNDAAWLSLTYARLHRRQPIVMFASRDPRFNTNTMSLAARLEFHTQIPMGQLLATRGGDTFSSYRAQLTDPALGQPNILVTSNNERDDYKPVVTQSAAEAAASSVGFRRFATLTLPDGKLARFWWLARGPAS